MTHPAGDLRARIAGSVRGVVELLVSGNYDQLERATNGQRLSADEIRNALNDYGRKLVMPPIEAFEHLDVIEVEGKSPRQWSVRMDLWTEEESDLSIELTVIQPGTRMVVVIDDLHVL